MKRLWHALICLFRSDCAVFKGDDFTRWAREQERDSIQATHRLRQNRETGNLLEDTIFPRAQQRQHEGPHT